MLSSARFLMVAALALGPGCRASTAGSESVPPSDDTSSDAPQPEQRGATAEPRLPRGCEPVELEHDGTRVRLAHARRLAQRAMEHYIGESVLQREEARRFGWVFWFVSRRFHETQDPNVMQVGAGPIAVHRDSGVACMLPGFPGAVDQYENEWLALR